jgi:hypothetical protein
VKLCLLAGRPRFGPDEPTFCTPQKADVLSAAGLVIPEYSPGPSSYRFCRRAQRFLLYAANQFHGLHGASPRLACLHARCAGLAYTPAVRVLVARAAAQRFRLASIIRFLPAALNFRLGLAARPLIPADPDLSRMAAHRFLWASAIRFLAAALILLPVRVPFGDADVLAVLRPLPESMARRS